MNTLKLIMQLLPLLMEAESNFDPNAVNGDAVGILQIMPIMVKDCYQMFNIDIEVIHPNDRYDVMYSIDVYIAYYRHYTKNFTVKHTMQELAAMWCASPDGYKQLDELKVTQHWERIKEAQANEKRKEFES